jgi:hypothetical protein
MRYLLALWLLPVISVLAHAKPEIRDIQAAHGLLGPERKSNEYVAGDEVYYRFTIRGARTDADGRLRGELRLTLTDAKGKEVVKKESPIQQVPVLGAESFPAQAAWGLGVDLPAGEYESTVEFADLLAKESTSFKRKFTVKPVEFAVVRVRFYHDAEERVLARAGGTVGQNLAIKLRAVGFDRTSGEIDVEMAIEVFDAQGKPVMPKPLRATVHNEKPAEVKEADWVAFSGLLTLNRAGDFVLRITVSDSVGKKKTQFETPLRVAAP